MLAGTLGMAEGVYFGAFGASIVAFDRSLRLSNAAANVMAGAGFAFGALSIGLGVYRFAEPWSGERLAGDYRLTLGKDGDYAHAFALADERLHELALAERSRRWLRGVSGGLLIAFASGIIIDEELRSNSGVTRFDTRAFGGAGILLGIGAIAEAFLIESPVERLLAVWNRDPGRLRLYPTLAPAPRGALVGVSGSF